ncbi:hypothetical protein THOG11_410001 [Vibrio harveyi]|nr:hypothetical protein THOD03_460007 [Vibrio harveyi]CAH1578546.1 hypothetical protein THOG11_410001 [Vibrio harveyi]
MAGVDWTGTPEIRYGLLPSGLAAQFPTRTIWALGNPLIFQLDWYSFLHIRKRL